MHCNLLPIMEDVILHSKGSTWSDRPPYEGRECIAIKLPRPDTPRTDLISLHRKLMEAGHTCIDRTNEVTPSILVVAPAEPMGSKVVNGWYSKEYTRIAGHHFTQTDVDGNGPREVSYFTYFTASDKPYSNHGDERLVGVFPDLCQPGEDRRRNEWVPAALAPRTPKARMADTEGLAHFTAMTATGPTP